MKGVNYMKSFKGIFTGDIANIIFNHELNVLVTGGDILSRKSLLQHLIDDFPAHKKGMLVETEQSLETKDKNIIHMLQKEDLGVFSHFIKTADLFKTDPIIFSEAPDKDAKLMLFVITAGHKGILSLDEKSIEIAVQKLENVCVQSGDNFSLERAKRVVHDSFDLIIELDGKLNTELSINKVVWRKSNFEEGGELVEILVEKDSELIATNEYSFFLETIIF